MSKQYPLIRVALFSLLTLTLALTGCRKNKPINFNAELRPGQLALRKIPLAQYPDFSQSTWNLGVLRQSIDNSLLYMSKPSSKAFFPYLDISHDRAAATLRALRLVVETANAQGPAAGSYINNQIRANFEVYQSIGAPKPDGSGYTDIVQFTGYCTPDRDASLVRTGPYQWPLYKRPNDLAADLKTGETLGRLLPAGGVEPYYTRAEIEGQNKLAGQEFAFLKSRWEAYVVTVQGSARLKLPDGRIMEVGYAGHNGYDYTSPGRAMVKDGILKPAELNLRTLGAYFAAHPDMAEKYLWMNQRTVFFTERPGGPFGKLNVPVTTFGTIATDKQVYPRAMPAFAVVPVPRTDNPQQTWPFRGFLLDQDAGGAIRAAGRADIYMGIGPAAEDLAGHQLHEGALYYIALKPEFIQRYSTPTPAEKPPTR